MRDFRFGVVFTGSYDATTWPSRRLELGLGAGWLKVEYVLAGLMFDPPGVRAGRFEEAVGIIRRLLDGEEVEHRGEHYRRPWPTRFSSAASAGGSPTTCASTGISTP